MIDGKTIRGIVLLLVLSTLFLKACGGGNNEIGPGALESPVSTSDLITIHDQAVMENPHNVMSAIYFVDGSGISSACVEYCLAEEAIGSDRSFQWSKTPSFEVPSERFILPVLGLLPGATYLMRAVLLDPVGGVMVTDPLIFRTGDLPKELDIPIDISGPMLSSGYVFISEDFSLSLAKDYILAVDPWGHIVWYTRIEESILHNMIGLSPHGTLLIFVMRIDGTMIHFEVDLFGNVVDRHELPILPSEQALFLDSHDFLLLPDGDKVFLCLKHYPYDLTPYGGPPDGTVVSSRIRRSTVDGTVTFDWDYMDAFPLTDSWARLDRPVVDWVHANSIDIDDDGNYILSSRAFSEVTKISSTDGSVLWRLGGKNNQFTFVDDELGDFSAQHAATSLGDGHILLFDNGLGHIPCESRAVEYRLDLDAMTATLVWEYRPDPPICSSSMSNAQRLPNGNTLINFGSPPSDRPRIIEVSRASEGIWDMVLPAGKVYRAFKFDSLYFGAGRVGGYRDLDGDGWFTHFDCDDRNPEAHPGAQDPCDDLDQDCDGLDGTEEIPGNGSDDDCDGMIDEDCFIGVVVG